MAGLVPAIHAFASAAPRRSVVRMRGGWVYIMTNRPNGTLYTGVTADISRRAYEHREGLCGGFTKRYRLTRLVWYEFHDGIAAAIQRERNMKHWPRAWKVRLILAMNPEWRDLYLDLNN
jgi:putative endonuclease